MVNYSRMTATQALRYATDGAAAAINKCPGAIAHYVAAQDLAVSVVAGVSGYTLGDIISKLKVADGICDKASGLPNGLETSKSGQAPASRTTKGVPAALRDQATKESVPIPGEIRSNPYAAKQSGICLPGLVLIAGLGYLALRGE
jgi:hypothetical protein